MGSKTSLRLPVIDFSDPELKQGTPQWNLVKAQAQQACEEYGCFEAFFNKVPLELRKALFSGMEALFDLPLQTKQQNQSEKPYHGYIGQQAVAPLYESMGIDDALVPENVECFTNLMWPEGNASFCKTIQSFIEQLAELDQMIRRMVLESLNLEKYMDEHLDSTNYLFRVMEYKGPQTSEVEVGVQAHTDKNTVTILCQNQVDGLEVQTKDGYWIKVKCSPGSFIAMIGDSFHAWTNGRVRSSYHRVMMTGNDSRFSIGLFSTPKTGYIIKAPEELVGGEHSLLFKPFDYLGFLRFIYSEAGRKAGPTLKTYCGA